METAMETRREVLEEWIDELQCWIEDMPDGIVRASLMDTHESVCRVLFNELVRTGEIQDYFLEA